MFEDLNDLYQQVILDHSKRPRNFRAMDGANRLAKGQNPLCGDNYTVFMLMENDVVKDVSFQGDGCAISKASASMMTEALKGKSKADAEKVFHEFHAMITEAKPASDALGKLGVLSGVNRFPARVKCAILSWHAANAALDGSVKLSRLKTRKAKNSFDMRYSEPIELKRDCPAIMIPAGTPTILPAGTEVTITQSLGGTYTVLAQGIMARIAGKDADALGIDTSAENKTEEYKGGPVDDAAVWDQMKNCYDPEIPVNIVDLGLIYDCKVVPLPEGGNRVDIKMTLTAPGCGMGPAIANDVDQRVRSVPGVSDVNVEVVWDPIWNQSMMSDAARLQLGLM